MPTLTAASDYHYDPIRGFYPERAEKTLPGGGVDFLRLPPLLRTLLVSDGTVTKFLEAFYWEPIRVRRIFHGDVELENDIPALEMERGRHALQRKVVLQGMRTERVYAYAVSYINTELLWPWVREDLVRGRLGIGELLRDQRVETYRELLSYGQHDAGALSEHLGVEPMENVIFRYYRIFMNRKPTLYISETFPVSHYEAGKAA